MKKLVLSIALAALGMSAQAFVTPENIGTLPIIKQKPELKQKLQTRASDNVLDFSYCYRYYTCVGSGVVNSYVYGFIRIPEKQAQQWKGAAITDVHIGFGIAEDKNVTVIITDDIEGVPLYSQDAVMETEQGWNSVALDTPYVLDGSEVYIGYRAYTSSKEDYPIGVDYYYSENTNADIFLVELPTGKFQMENVGTYVGNISLGITLQGESLPKNSGSATYLDLPGYVPSNTPFNGVLYVQNNGVEEISSLDVTVKINGEVIENKGVTFPEGYIGQGVEGLCVINNLSYSGEGKNIPIVVSIDKVNGSDNEALLDTSIQGSMMFSEISYPKNVLIEEFTGTGCGWCPRGIVGMAYMEEKYGDDGFIGVAVHSYSGDPMASATYNIIGNLFSNNAYPSAVVNRTYYFDPAADTMEEYYKLEKQFDSFANITVAGSYNEDADVVNVTGVAEFGLNLRNAGYAVAYAITENNVGPYMQQNFFATNKDQYLEGWSSLPARVSTIYNEVARIIVDPFGIEGSIPATITKGQGYSSEAELSCANIKDINNCKLIAMILDTETYSVVNSVKSDITIGDAGVDGIMDNAPELLKVYNTQGVKVLETKDSSELKTLPKGIYIINGKKAVL